MIKNYSLLIEAVSFEGEPNMSEEDKELSLHSLKEKAVPLVLCGSTFLISTHFSMNDMIRYIQTLEHGDGAKYALIDIVYSKLQKCESPIPTLNEICLEDEHVFEPYIMAVIDRTQAIQTTYLKTDTSLSLSERFAIAVRDFEKDCSKRLAESMQPMLKTIDQINRSVDFSWLSSLSQMVKQYQPVINSAVIQFAQQTAEIMAPIQRAIAQYADTFSSIIGNIQIPTFTEEQKRQLEENYKAWGSFGWSAIPHAPIKLFNEAPADMKEADKTALRYFNKEGMERLFAYVQEQPIKKGDLSSAIFCFENRQYKACAILLFSVIDAKLIRLQSQKGGKNRRQVGNKAVRRLEEKFKEKADTEFFLYHMLYFSGLIECLRTFFADGNDFHEEPLVINRNFIDHGMNRRRVRKKDCIQLFLALYNLTEILENL